MRQLRQHIRPCGHLLTFGHQHAAIDRKLYFGKASEAQVRTALALAHSLSVTQECTWSKPEPMPVKLQNNIVILIRAHPQTSRFSGHLLVRPVAAKIHDLALDRTTGRVGSKTVHTNNDLVCFAIQDALVRQADADHGAIYRADDAQWHSRNIAPWIAKHENEVDEQNHQWNRIIDASVLPGNANSDQRNSQKGQALPGDKWTTPAYQADSFLFVSIRVRGLAVAGAKSRVEYAPPDLPGPEYTCVSPILD